MLHAINIKAPAKINIYLRVLPKRDDGFHGIESIFQKVPLFDELSVLTTDTFNTCTVICKEMELPVKNTITTMYEEYVKETGIKTGVSVKLKKHIPSGAGLGGGSSDAASFLSALDILFDTRLPFEIKKKLAAKIGSDVVFFLGSDCALVTGRGEFVTKMQARRDLFFVLVTPEVHNSTKEAYALLDEWMAQNIEKSVLSLDDVKSMYYSDVSKWSFANTFTFPQVEHYPIINTALCDIKSTNALFVDMSGSGSSVFGVYRSAQEAQVAFNVLSKKWKRCWWFASSDCAIRT